MSKTIFSMRPSLFAILVLLCLQLSVSIVLGSRGGGRAARVVKREERNQVYETELGSISTVDIHDGTGRRDYHLQFIALESNSTFVPVLLHADMVLYVHSGSGILSWTEGDKSDKMNQVNLQRGDLYRLTSGSIFYLNSSLEESESQRLKITAIFTDSDEEQVQGPSVGPYSSINELLRGFDKPILQAAFQVPEEVIDELTNTTDKPAIIVQADQQSKQKYWEEIMFINTMFGMPRFSKQEGVDNKKKKHTRTFNFFRESPDFENCYGWSTVVTKHDLKALHGSQIGVHMVNLTKGAMMAPHWNPYATEISVVLEGEGMVQVVCASALTNKDCENTRLHVEEGDVFMIPRFYPAVQLSFNNGSLVYLGFSTAASKKNRPQFLAGKDSILQTLDEGILRVSFNVSDKTVEQLLGAHDKSIMTDCTSCAEMIEEETGRGRPEDEERKREEEQEEERRRPEKEEERRREEEEEEEKQRRHEEEEERRQEEEDRRRRQEEEEEEEEERPREEEEERRRRQEEEEEERREEEERGEGEEETEEWDEGSRWANTKFNVNKRKRGSKWKVA